MDSTGEYRGARKLTNREIKRRKAEHHNALYAKGGPAAVEGPRMAEAVPDGNRAQKRAAVNGRGGEKTSRSRPLKQMKGGSGHGLDKIHALIRRGLR